MRYIAILFVALLSCISCNKNVEPGTTTTDWVFPQAGDYYCSAVSVKSNSDSTFLPHTKISFVKSTHAGKVFVKGISDIVSNNPAYSAIGSATISYNGTYETDDTSYLWSATFVGTDSVFIYYRRYLLHSSIQNVNYYNGRRQ